MMVLLVPEQKEGFEGMGSPAATHKIEPRGPRGYSFPQQTDTSRLPPGAPAFPRLLLPVALFEVVDL